MAAHHHLLHVYHSQMKLPSQNLIHHFLLLVVAVLTASPLYATDEVELIPFGSSWRWHHPTNGVDPGPTFQSTWMNAASSGFANNGTAPLGYGVSDWGALAQDIGTPPSGSRHTAYFKTTFSVPSELNGQFFVQILCDDGAAIYVDGKPAGRFNFAVADSYTARASTLSDESRMQMVRLSVPPDPLPDAWQGPDHLSAGTHTIAVSVHNFDPTSSDLAFDLSLFFVPHGSDLPIVVAPDGRRFIAVYLPGTTWSRDEAADQAARWAVGGKLATIRSQADNNLVFNLIDKRRIWGVRRDAGGITICEGPLIGGLQLPTGVEPSGGWTWGDNTLVTYTSWAPGEPNEAIAGQDLMRYWSTGARRSTWDDESLTHRFSSFVMELPPVPELSLTSHTRLSKSRFSIGEELRPIFEITNLGQAPSNPCILRISVFDETDNLVIPRLDLQLPAIPVNAVYQPSVPAISGGTLIRGNMRIHAYLDPLSANPDANRNNNSFLAHFYVEDVGKIYAVCLGATGGVVRGDLGAIRTLIELKQFPNWCPNSINPQHAIVFNGDNTGVKSLLFSKLDQIATSITTSDTLVIYYNGHGGPLSPVGTDDGEAPVTHKTVLEFGDFFETVTNNDRRDEYLGIDLSDDELTAKLSQPPWPDVKKILILDCCHAGGFYGSNSTSDSGDLEKTRNTLLLGATDETNLTILDDDGAGAWTNQALIPALADVRREGGDIQFLYDKISIYKSTRFFPKFTTQRWLLEPPGRFGTVGPPETFLSPLNVAGDYFPVSWNNLFWIGPEANGVMTVQWPISINAEAQESHDMVKWLPLKTQRVNGQMNECQFDANAIKKRFFRVIY